MNPVTLRNLPPELAKIIRKKAHENQISMNKAVIQLLEESAGNARRRRKILHHDLDALAGSWTKNESKTFEEALAVQRVIDRDIWK